MMNHLIIVSMTFRAVFLGLLLMLTSNFSQAQQQINIQTTPAFYTPLFDDIFLAGNFNNWNPADPTFKFIKQANGTYLLNLNLSAGFAAECKITRGSWPSTETQLNGNFLPNRTFTAQNNQTLNYSVANWEDMLGWHTAVGNTHIVSLSFPMPAFNTSRRVWIYLPQDYYVSSDDYPVLYLHDGQNLFDAVYTAFGTEWGIDESMVQLEDSNYTKAIIVGIDNGGANRINEYSPWVNPAYGGGMGESYMNFIVNELKPFVDLNFRTKPGRDFTGLGGSSLGGLISMFGLLEYQHVFSKGLIFSPSFWFSDSCFTHAAQIGFQHPCRIYFMAGQNESATMVPKINQMHNTLLAAGHSASNMQIIIWGDGQHSEWFWKREYPAGYRYLFHPNPVTSTREQINSSSDFATWNSALSQLQFTSSGLKTIRVYSLDGRLIHQGNSSNLNYAIELPQGIFIAEILDEAKPVQIIKLNR
jgi:predicted alpha/beta superfamily hydrolase